ncbi:MAG: hypothetical protein VW339_02220, partial [Quisquiliibacterium sp.]
RWHRSTVIKRLAALGVYKQDGQALHYPFGGLPCTLHFSVSRKRKDLLVNLDAKRAKVSLAAGPRWGQGEGDGCGKCRASANYADDADG